MRILKWVIIGLILIVLLSVGCFSALSKKAPGAIAGQSGDALAEKVLESLNEDAWDSLAYLKWEFMGGHKYQWDKQNNIANIKWSDNEVILDLDTQTGKTLSNGQEVTGDKKSKLLSRAWSFWCNDSFWMFAPFKLNDPGTTREVVKLKEGGQGLKVTYGDGGVTPGDVYVWHLGDDYVPTAYQMWVKILPVKGMKVTWEDWQEINGAKLASKHGSKMMNFQMKGLAGGQSLSDIEATASTFNLQ